MSVATTINAERQAIEQIPVLSTQAFHDTCVEHVGGGRGRLVALMAIPGAGELFAAIGQDEVHQLLLLRGRVEWQSFPSLTKALPQAQAFEREISEIHGLMPDEHPWLKSLRRHEGLELRSSVGERALQHPFFQVDGDGVHEVAVGPVHAGIIEPGHFRFQCQGELVHHLEIQLGYQHRGLERLFLSATPARRLVLAEQVAGDTSIGHASAYCQALESLAGTDAPPRAQQIRCIALELERIANHVGDLGALCGDIGYLPGLSYFGRLRGDALNLSLELCGNRFGRGLVCPGGVRFDLTPEQCADFESRLQSLRRDFESTAAMAFDQAGVVNRFEKTGVLTRAQANELGLVGPCARAAGCTRDVRIDHPFGFFRNVPMPLARRETGDVMARAQVRKTEIDHSIQFVLEQLAHLESSPLRTEVPPLASSSLVVSLVEGWRGEVAHVAITGADGSLVGYKIFDPSFHNWFGLAIAMRGNQISDFPLCNKSFNLSYCGHDL